MEEQLLGVSVAGIDPHAPQWTFIECVLQPLLQLRRVRVLVPRMEVKSLKSSVFKVFGLDDTNQCTCLLQPWSLLREISVKAVSLQPDLKITALYRIPKLQWLEMCSHQNLPCKICTDPWTNFTPWAFLLPTL